MVRVDDRARPEFWLEVYLDLDTLREQYQLATLAQMQEQTGPVFDLPDLPDPNDMLPDPQK